MFIKDLQYLENVDSANKISGSFGNGLIGLFGQTGGNFGFGEADSDVLGDNTFSESKVDVNVIQGTGSSSSASALGIAIPG